MKVLSAENIRKLDAYTIKNEPIKSIDLMEKASKVFTKYFRKKYAKKNQIAVFSGMGNNGADGLAVSRLLLNKDFQVTTFIIEFSKKHSDNFKENLNRLKDTPESKIHFIQENQEIDFSSFDVIIDAIFGSGISKPITGFTKEIVKKINQSKLPIVAIDIPSGLSCDEMIEGEKIKATSTLSFELPKLSFLLPENNQFCGDWTFKSIGLMKEFINQCTDNIFFTTLNDAKKIIRKRAAFSHKGTNGHSLIVSGKLGSIGASVLAAKGSVASGSGLTTIHTPKCGITILQTVLPEAMLSIDLEENFISKIEVSPKVNAIGIGPGIGTDKKTTSAIESLLNKINIPLVLDADALNILAENQKMLKLIPENSILTPHPKEFERLVGGWGNDYERLNKLKAFSKKLNVICVLKGAFTSIALPNGEVHFNSTGNNALSTGGSGDVLTGIITGLIAQNYEPKQAAILGVFLHGLAADLHQKNIHSERMMASEIIDFLGKAFEKILKR